MNEMDKFKGLKHAHKLGWISEIQNRIEEVRNKIEIN